MRNPLEGHPAWRQLAIVSIVLPAVVALAVLAFAWPAARISPRHVPIGVVGALPASQQLVSKLGSAEPGAFDLHLYPDIRTAEAAIRNREIYGAFADSPGQLQILDASAAGPAVSQLLTGVGAKLEAASRPPVKVSTVDVVPLSSTDPKGMVLTSALLPLTICGVIVAIAVGLVVRFRPAWRQILALVVVALVASTGIYLVAQGWFGALPQHGFADWGALALTILALSAGTAGLIAFFGPPGVAMAAALFVFVGNPFSGVTSAPEMLPGAANHLGQWLPPGAGANLLRSTAYFGGAGAGGHFGVLLAWSLLGCGAIVVGHHAPIGFAAASSLPREHRLFAGHHGPDRLSAVLRREGGEGKSDLSVEMAGEIGGLVERHEQPLRLPSGERRD
jgi:hypothetical protein